MNRGRGRKIIKYAVFVAYIAMLVYLVLFAEMFGRTAVSREYRYNLVPFKEISRFITYYHQLGFTAVMLNLVGNIVAFMPFGFCLPMLSDRRTGLLKVTVFSFALSLAIELMQLVTRVGSCDVDDLILNTLGGVLGYACYILVCNMCRRFKQESGDKETEDVA
ncbi:MAG: VanZ family protein [Lachnospira sp.]|nr:VanZ family protein [Lachnospira sp.]